MLLNEALLKGSMELFKNGFKSSLGGLRVVVYFSLSAFIVVEQVVVKASDNKRLTSVNSILCLE